MQKQPFTLFNDFMLEKQFHSNSSINKINVFWNKIYYKYLSRQIQLYSIKYYCMQDFKQSPLTNLQAQENKGTNKQHKKDYKRKVYDNIHEFIEFEKKVWDFIDTPHFQRLRKIKQTGCLEYVFPTSTHTRFEHSLGTAHLAHKFIQLLIKNHPKLYEKQDKQSVILTVTLAGLLHDLGHGPYSHMFDSHIVNKFTRNGQVQKWTHELASQILFQHMTQLPHLKDHLTALQIGRVKNLIRGNKVGQRQWEFDLISNKINGIDVDKFDYFRRDSRYLGAKYIYIDHDLLMNQARIIGNEICYPSKYAQTVNNIFYSRYKIYKNYYNNIISTGIEQMICDILILTNGVFHFQEACDQIQKDANAYLKLNDNIVERVEQIYDDRLIQDSSNKQEKQQLKQAVDIIKRIKARDLYKFVSELTYYFEEEKDKINEQEKQKKREEIQSAFQKEIILGEIITKINKQANVIDKFDQSDICITISDVGFGLKDQNPLRKVGFFRKEQEEEQRKKLSQQVVTNLSMLYTTRFIERSIKFYIKKKQKAKKYFSEVSNVIGEWRKQNSNIKLLSGSIGKSPTSAANKNPSGAIAAEPLSGLK